MYTENVENYEVFTPLILQKDDNLVSKIIIMEMAPYCYNNSMFSYYYCMCYNYYSLIHIR